MKGIKALFVILIIYSAAQAQDSTMLKLQQHGKTILSRQPDSLRLEAQVSFRLELDSLLSSTQDTLLPLDSLKNLSVLYTPDSSVRVITWLFPFSNGAYSFYGYLHYFNPTDSSWNLLSLKDRHKEIKEPTARQLDTKNWYGALYYDIIVKDSLINLLGWNGYHNQKNEKIIEVLWFDEEGQPRFGKRVFPEYRSGFQDSVRRVIFQYANDASMSLRYSNVLRQVLEPNENRMAGGMKRVKIRQDLIVFNKLDPIQPMFEGDFRYYVPLTETLQGFYFENGKWLFQDEVIILSEQAPVTGEGSGEINLFPSGK